MTHFVISEHVEATPGICGGKPCIAGHRIRVQDVVVWHEAHGLCPDEIVAQHPGISLADVYAALAYYHDHRDEIRKDMEEGDRRAEEFIKQHPSKILHLNGPDDDAGSISP